MTFMRDFKGEIQELINKKPPALDKEQSAKKPSTSRKRKPVQGREATPHPKSRKWESPALDFTKYRFPTPGNRKPVRHIQADGSRKTYTDARLLLEQKKSDRLSESASTSNLQDSLRNTSMRHTQSYHES